MLLSLIRKEILQHLMSLRFAIACVLCLVVILCSILVRCRDYSQLLDDYAQESAMAREQLNSVNWPWAFSMQIFTRPNPMKILVRGVSGAKGRSVRVSPRELLELDFPELDNPSAALFPSTDLVMFVGVIMSLLAIVFGYDAICGEKEHGTLRLMLSYSVPRSLSPEIAS